MKLLKLPVVGSFIKRLEKNTEIAGIIFACRQVIARSHSQVEIQGLTAEIQQILSSNSVIVAANHPNEAEVIPLLAAIPDRKDIYLIINVHFTKLGKALDHHLIPVYIQHNINVKKNRVIKRTLLSWVHPLEFMHIDAARARNRQSISHASNKLNQGGLVMIFPARRSPTGQWYPGIGYMAHGAKQTQKLYFVGAHITGTSDLDYVRMLPFIGLILPKITVKFSKPIEITSWRSKDPKEITVGLEKYYFNSFHLVPVPE